MKPLKPTLREKNRYILCVCLNKDFRKLFEKKFKELYGKINYSLAGIKIITQRSVNNKHIFILKANRKFVKEVVGCFIFLDTRAIKISGTLKKLEKELKNYIP
ncbi:MAG: hypothetical protein QW524_02875 [Candidatus Woesearchaeota archaeon]